MKSNLANVYALLLKKVREPVTVTYTLPASYLCKIIGYKKPEELEQKIIFLYEDGQNTYEKNALNISDCQPVGASNKKADRDLDLTGSPLKDDCIVEALSDLSIDANITPRVPWKLEEECHIGINIEKARAIINSEDFQAGAEVADANGSVWFLCNGNDSENTLLMQYVFNEGSFTRGIVTFTGVVSVSSLNSIQTMLLTHYMSINSKAIPLETSIENVYQIKNDIMIRCSWSTTSSMPSLIDLNSCDVFLSQKFRMTECSYLTQDLMNQLLILMSIREDIINYKANGDNLVKGPSYSCGGGIEIDELRDTINKIIKNVAVFTEVEHYSDAEYDVEAVVQRSKSRPLVDLTDKLWDVLRHCSSYKDLKTAFNMIFQSAVRCNIVNTPTNKNRLAEIITEISNRRLAIPCLTGTEPLELLLEIGMEKIYKDYEYIFTQSKICGAKMLKDTNMASTDGEINENLLPNVRKSLRNAVRIETKTPRKTFLHNAKGTSKQNSEEIVGFKNSNFDEVQTSTQLSKLLQIHCTLEHLLIIQINLNFNNVYRHVCEELLRKPLKPLVGVIDDTFIDEMEISLGCHIVRDILTDKDPYSRCITMKSKNKFRHVQSTFFYSMENVCPPKISECFQGDDKEMAKENVYYSWLYRWIHNEK